MSKSTAHFRVSRYVEPDVGLLNKVDAVCEENITPDMSEGVFMPVMRGSLENMPHGARRYKVVGSLALPILDIVRPQPPYRRVFNHAAFRFDDGGRTVDAQVTRKISERWAEQFPGADPTYQIMDSTNLVTDITRDGYQLSARIEDNEGKFQIDYDAVQELMHYIGNMKQYRKLSLDFTPERPFEPQIPLVRFNESVSDEEVGAVYEQLLDEMPTVFQIGDLMPPKVY